MTDILAKSSKVGLSLIDHTADVIQCVRAIFGGEHNPSRLGRCWQNFFQFDSFSLFFRCTLTAAGLHDLGKANDGFQNAVRSRGSQVIRHEHLSGLLMGLDSVNAWLRSGPELDLDVVLSAVICHHLKAKEEEFAQRLSDRDRIKLLTDRNEFTALLDFLASELQLTGPRPEFPFAIWRYGRNTNNCFHLEPLREEIVENRLYPLGKSCRRDRQRHQLLMAGRSALIAADSVGSARLRMKTSMTDWIQQAFDESRVCDAD